MNFVISFLQDLLKLIRLESSNKPPNKREEDVKDAYKWLIDKIDDRKQTEVQEHNDPYLQPGKIYVFKYEPKYKDRYDYYDKYPVVFALGKIKGLEGLNNVGINISWYPPKARKFIIETIQKMYKSQYDSAKLKSPKKANDQKSIEIDLYAMKTALDQFGFSFAIRQYIPSKIKSPKVCISYEHFDKAIRLDQPKIIPEVNGKVTLMQIYKDFEDYVKKCHQNKGEMKKKMDEAKKQNKYKFIK